MKFGTQILDKSVPEWKLNNIDYQQLKVAIKKCTSVRDTREPFEPKRLKDDPELYSLKKMFQSQLQMVNVFISMKLKECSTRIVSIENYLSQLGSIQDAKKRLRRFKLINQHLDRCNLELQKLSRYLILQKIAVRKLFKKFTKHYPYSEEVAKEFIDSLRQCPEMVEGHDGISLLTVDLDPYLLEISLIVDILHEMEGTLFEATGKMTKDKTKVASDGTFGTEHIPNPRKGSVSSNLPLMDSNVKFDHFFLSKFTHLQSFLISQESEDEIKFLLLNSGFCLFEDSVIATSKKILNGNSLLYKKKGSIHSMQSLRSIHEDDRSSPKDSTDTSQHSTSNLHQDSLSTSPVEPSSNTSQHGLFEAETSSSFNITFEPLVKPGANLTDIYKSKEDNLYPNILISYPNSNNSIMMCHVGGLRDHISTDAIECSHIDTILDGSEPALYTTLSRLDELCLEWCYSHNLKKADISIKTKRTRFVANNSTRQNNAEYLICLDDQIEINGAKLPYAILEIKSLEGNHSLLSGKHRSQIRLDPILSQITQKLVQDRLSVYPSDNDLTLWKLASSFSQSYDSLSVIENGEIGSIDQLFERGRQLLKEMHDKNEQKRNPPTIDFGQHAGNVQISTEDLDKPRIHYWNEFDDGEEGTDQGFYSNSEEEKYINGNDNGLINFSPSFIVSIYHLLTRFQSALGMVDDARLKRPLLRRDARSYNSLVSGSTMNTSTSSERNEVNKFWDLEEQTTDSIYEFEHDQVIFFFYVSSLLIASVTTGITIGIMTSLFESLNDDTELEKETPILTMIIVSLSISLILSAWSLVLLFSRFSFAPTWHYFTGITIFIIIIFAVCYGFIELLI